MKLYHVSYDRIENFVLRIPQNRLPMEDSATPRICLSTSIKRCVNAKPSQGEALYIAQEQGLRVAFYVYEFDTESIPAKNLIPPKTLKEHYGVLDAEQNEEYWIVGSIVPYQEVRYECFGGKFRQLDNENQFAQVLWLDLNTAVSRKAVFLEHLVMEYNKNVEAPVTTDIVLTELSGELSELICSKNVDWSVLEKVLEQNRILRIRKVQKQVENFFQMLR